MKTILCFVSAGIMAYAIAAEAGQTERQTPAKSQPIRATYLITGLHCPPCTRTVESSLRNVKGIRSVRVDWKSKNARVEFDEAVLPAQRVALLIADTPHMMGRNMQYGGWLALKVPELKDGSTAQAVKDALSKVAGVKRVTAYPAQKSVAVQFGSEGAVTSRQLIESLSQAGFNASNF